MRGMMNMETAQPRWPAFDEGASESAAAENLPVDQ